MCYNYDNIVHEWFESLKLPFVNYIRANFVMSYDDVLDLYTEVWLEVRRIIMEGRATDNKWKALIFKIGYRKAMRVCQQRPDLRSVSDDGDDERFNPVLFEMEKKLREMEAKTLYEDADLLAVLSSELSYIPDKCNKILKLYYCENISLKEIAQALRYKTSRSVIVTKKRCVEKLKSRVERAMHLLSKI